MPLLSFWKELNSRLLCDFLTSESSICECGVSIDKLDMTVRGLKFPRENCSNCSQLLPRIDFVELYYRTHNNQLKGSFTAFSGILNLEIGQNIYSTIELLEDKIGQQILINLGEIIGIEVLITDEELKIIEHLKQQIISINDHTSYGDIYPFFQYLFSTILANGSNYCLYEDKVLLPFSFNGYLLWGEELGWKISYETCKSLFMPAIEFGYFEVCKDELYEFAKSKLNPISFSMKQSLSPYKYKQYKEIIDKHDDMLELLTDGNYIILNDFNLAKQRYFDYCLEELVQDNPDVEFTIGKNVEATILRPCGHSMHFEFDLGSIHSFHLLKKEKLHESCKECYKNEPVQDRINQSQYNLQRSLTILQENNLSFEGSEKQIAWAANIFKKNEELLRRHFDENLPKHATFYIENHKNLNDSFLRDYVQASPKAISKGLNGDPYLNELATKIIYSRENIIRKAILELDISPPIDPEFYLAIGKTKHSTKRIKKLFHAVYK